ncbi:hypothetical protein DY000_02024515 [Brassica cretica]|uniref:NB-ARC domain-containing protein n=2 Tax=Brassica cretica TaxID=69181 RepID=A0ABQ7E664_BRACR|nr:hypothetical protein DY000_02024515 [Brassica cretica]
MRSKHDGKEIRYDEFTLESLKDELSESKVLIVLDDVSEKSQIDMILGGRKWLREGSRVVITTSSKFAITGMVDETYLVPGLSDEDGFKYFEKHAFTTGSCEPRFMRLAREFVDYSRGHPLALKVLGGELLTKDEAYWVSKLGELAKSPISKTIHNVLRSSYDDLSKHHKDLFLDVACFFRSEDEYHVSCLLDSSVQGNVSEIRHLADKFLITICGGRLELNDLMYTFAMGLESQSSSENSASGRRLFNHGEIIAILLNKAKATKVRGIFLDMSDVGKMSLDIDLEGHDLESVLSYDSDDDDAICGYSEYDNSSESSLDDDDDCYDDNCCFKITKMPRHDEIQTPHLPVTIFDPSCQEDPVYAIAFIDTGAHTTIVNPKILSPTMWLPHQQEFHIDLEGHDLESVLSYDSDDDDAICGYSEYDNSSESSLDDDDDCYDDDCCFKITIMPRHDEIQTPHLPVTIFDPSCQEDPVYAIAFIDTRAHTTIVNPKILSPTMWLPHQQEFRVANSESLTIKLKSKQIKIELFPGCHIITEVLGSTAPGKDLILGWDSYYAFKKTFDISIEPRRLR